MEALDACAGCGGGLELVSAPDAHPAVFACRRCGRHVHVEVNPSVAPPAPPPSFRVVAEWSGPASASLAHALRRVDPSLAQRPAGLVLSHLRGLERWDLGVHEGEQAERLEARCRREGLRVRRLPAGGDETSRSTLPEPPAVPVDRGVTIHFVWIVLAVGALVAGVALWLSG